MGANIIQHFVTSIKGNDSIDQPHRGHPEDVSADIFHLLSSETGTTMEWENEFRKSSLRK